MIFNPRRGGGSKSEFEVVITGTPPSNQQAGSLKIGGTAYTEAQTVKVPRNTLLIITARYATGILKETNLIVNGEKVASSGSKNTTMSNAIPVTSDIAVDFYTTSDTITVTTQ